MKRSTPVHYVYLLSEPYALKGFETFNDVDYVLANRRAGRVNYICIKGSRSGKSRYLYFNPLCSMDMAAAVRTQRPWYWRITTDSAEVTCSYCKLKLADRSVEWVTP